MSFIPIPFNPAYIVGDDGTVRRLARLVLTKRHTYEPREERTLSPKIDTRGYCVVTLRNNGVRREFSVHRLVAEAHVPGHAPTLVVDHINGNKLDNRACNLRWVTASQNTALFHEMLRANGKKHVTRFKGDGK